MKTQQYIWRYVAVITAVIVFAATSILFVKWLYIDSDSETALAAFSDYGDTTKLEKYSNNVYINIINSTIPAAKVSFEAKYGQKLPGIASTVTGQLFNGVNFDIKDPKTYFSFVFTAFSQYEPEDNLVAITEPEEEKLPDIINFDEAPEGAIYFSEQDEYKAEETQNVTGDTTNLTDTSNEIEGSEIPEIADPARLAIEKKDPSILILHSHSMESYSPFTANNYHSLNDKENVVGVGNVMTDILESKFKYNVIHDKTRHDKISYAESYINSQKTIISQLDRNKTLKVVLDIHRDAFSVANERDAENRKAEYTTKINGKSAARVMLVIGDGNKNYAELKKFAVYIQKKMDKLYPGLFYKIVTKPGKKYNQYYRDHSMLIEVGSTLNTDEEARYTGELMGHVIGEVLKDLEK